MSRPCGIRVAWTAVLVFAAGCQNYNFNPVGHCVVQPGSQTFTLSNLSTADVLFVIDDSGSMAGEQDRLAASFNSFINNLNQTNLDRASGGLKPIDFHLAVTTTSVFYNYVSTATTWTCKQSCGTAGQTCCTSTNQPVKIPRSCTSDSQCGGGNVRCLDTCHFNYLSPAYGPFDLLGEKYCCDQTTLVAPLLDNMSCSVVGATCGTFEKHYDFAGTCQAGVATDGYPYPAGAFVGASTNPRVLHFDKELYPSTPNPSATNRQGFTRTDLVNFFAGNPVGTNANVKVGTCGSGEEQALEAARLAVQKALAGQQTDTYSMSPGKVQTPSAAEWPHPESKLVLVFVGDEDDCSSPSTDASSGIVLLSTDSTGTDDACTRDDGGKKYDVASRYVDWFMGLGRPVGAAFIASFVGTTSQSACGRDAYGTCSAGRCCQENCPTANVCSTTSSPTYCGGQGAGIRYLAAASAFAARGADVVTGSVCDAGFDVLLDEIAEIVKVPSTLILPTTPAADDITVLRIAHPNGTDELCGRPLPPGTPTNYTLAQAQDVVNPDTGKVWGWWFTATQDAGPPVAPSQYVYINPNGSCLASPGDTYSAEYIGRIPASGCHTEDDCRAALGGTTDSWTCFAGMDAGTVDTCASTSLASGRTGTCLCGSLSKNCPNGKLP